MWIRSAHSAGMFSLTEQLGVDFAAGQLNISTRAPEGLLQRLYMNGIISIQI